MLRTLLFALAILVAVPAVQAQDAYDQDVIGEFLEREGALPDAPVEYAVYRIAHPSGNSILGRLALYTQVGEGDPERGRARLRLTELFGAPSVEGLRTGDTVIMPARPADFDLNALAYAPYPRTWPGAAAIAKAVIVDKTTQTWAAYANGALVRWGPVSSGAAHSPTPTGRFNMNWRAMERESSEAPPGETWYMRYVMNIYAARGIHLHQYNAVLTGPPQGHGCVRMVTSDARWLYEWSDQWRVAADGRVTTPGTLVIVQGDEPPSDPERFVMDGNTPRRIMVELPPDPMAVPRGDQ